MKLIMTSYSQNTSGFKPSWIDILKNSDYLKLNNVSVYDPSELLSDSQESSVVKSLKSNRCKINDNNIKFIASTSTNDIHKSYDDISDRFLKSYTTFYSSETEFQSNYVLSRSDLLIADLNEPCYGRMISEICTAHSIGIPVIGILHKCIIDPFVQNRLNAIISINSIDDIIRQILAFTIVN